MERQAPAPRQSRTAFSIARGRSPELADGRVAVIAVLLALAGAAWVATALRMSGMDAGPGTSPGALGFYLTTWVVMMAAMMFPSIAPMVLTYLTVQRVRQGHGRTARAGGTGLFVAGYLAVWGMAGLVAYAVLEEGRSLDGGIFAWGRAGRWTAAAVLLVAAAYQFTPSKSACLTRCRASPGLLHDGCHEGRGGALRMGIDHGAWCVGCCWALMAALFALGAMSIAWMVLISTLIAAEKLLPRRALVTRGVAGVLAAVALGMAAAPTTVPALTIPGSASAMRAMDMSPPSQMQMPAPMRTAPRTGMPHP
jgi:predicted metal-binding membrane protein